MTVAFSFHGGDKPQGVALAQWIRRLGGVENHDCLIVHPTTTDADGIEEPLRQAFRYVEVMTYTPQLEGWPQGPNELHARTAFALALHKKITGPWLFLEADCLPTTSHWLNQIASTHQRSGRPMLGTLNDSIDSEGRMVGRHVIGVAVYPQDFARIVPLVKNIITTSAEYAKEAKRTGDPKLGAPPFDCYYGPYTVEMTHVSPLIQHLWCSENYREQDGQIVCDFRKPNRYPPVVNPDAVLIHGCKDGSLLQILQARNPQAAPIEAPRPLITPAVIRQPVPQPVAVEPPAPALIPPRVITPTPVQPITEAELDAPVGTGVMPPFPKGSPEQKRHAEIFGWPWTKLQKYAARTLKIKGFGIQRPELVNNIVLKEREDGKEPWTEQLRQPAAPVQPLEPVRQWKAGTGEGEGMSQAQYERMMSLRSRATATV